VSTICGDAGPVQLEAFILILGMEMQNRKMLKRATVGVITDRMDKYMNGNKVKQWEGRINERNLGFRMQTAVRGEAVTRVFMSCFRIVFLFRPSMRQFVWAAGSFVRWAARLLSTTCPKDLRFF
jgi:hypothetical protein